MRIMMRAVALFRIALGILVVAVLGYAYGIGIPVNGASPFDYFGFFTNQTSLITSAILIAAGVLGLRQRPSPDWLDAARAIATACMLVVAVIYNVLVPGTGSAPVWVSVLLHVLLPLAVMLDWLLVGDRRPLPWRLLWIVLPYPVLWLIVVLVRGATDGWVPYGFLLPQRGLHSLTIHIIALLTALLMAGAVVWSTSRLPGLESLRGRSDAVITDGRRR